MTVFTAVAPVLVTGGAGFVGTAVCRLLTQLEVPHTICDRVAPQTAGPLTSYVDVDIRDLGGLEAAARGHRSIIHLAAEWNDVGVPDAEYATTNVDGTRNVALAAERAGVRTIIFTSSSAVYDFEDGRSGAYGEDHSAPSPPTLYGKTKAAGERILAEWQAGSESKRLQIVRPSVIHGPGNFGNMYGLIRQVLSGTFVFPNDRTVVKSIAYVENVAALCAHLLTWTGLDVLTCNYCDHPPMTTYELVRLVGRLGQVRAPLVCIPPRLLTAVSLGLDRGPRRVTNRFGSMKVKKFLRPTQLANDRVFAVTGFRQPVANEEGLSRTVAWVKTTLGDGRARETGAEGGDPRPSAKAGPGML